MVKIIETLPNGATAMVDPNIDMIVVEHASEVVFFLEGAKAKPFVEAAESGHLREKINASTIAREACYG